MDRARFAPPALGGTEAGAGLEHAITTASTRIASHLLRRNATANKKSGPTAKACTGSHGKAGPGGTPVLGSETGAATAKHSVVALVRVAGAETPFLAGSGA